MKKYSIRLHSLLNTSTLIVLGILYLNLLSACTFTISCNSYLPTLSYLSTFRGHDTLTIIALSFFSLALIPVFYAYSTFFDEPLNQDDRLFLKIHEIAIIPLIIIDGIIDESSGIDFYPIDDLHRFLSFAICMICCDWGYWIINFIGKNPIKKKLEKDFQILKTLYVIGVVFMVITIMEWQFAYTVYNGMIFNHLVESICEWILITVAIRFPYHLTKVLNLRLNAYINNKIKD